MWTPQPQSKDVQRIFTLFKQEPQERFLPSFCSGGMRNILSEKQKSSLRRELPSVYCLLTRTFSLKFLHVYDANVQYTNARTLREVLPCTFPLWEMREPVGLLTQVYSGSIWRILARSYYAHFMSNSFPKLHFKNMPGCSEYDPYVHWEYVKVISAQLRVTRTNRTQREELGWIKY